MIRGSLSESGSRERLQMHLQKIAVFVFCFCSFPWSFPLASPTVSGSAAHRFQQGGSLVGQIRDKNGAVIANAIVELYAQSGEKILETRSNEDGTFGFSGVQVGEYLVKVTIPGFGVTGAQAHVTFGENSRLEITINPVEVSSSSSASTEPPVYNALFSPILANGPTHLLSGKKTQLRFYIGPRNEKNALSIGQWTVNPKILEETENIPLTVTMTCRVCQGDRVQSRVITFSGKEQKSSEAAFSFVPTSSLAKKNGTILLDIMSRGVTYNHIVIAVQVDPAVPPTRPGSADRQGVADLGAWAVPKQPEEVPDLILTLGRDGNGSISLQIEPVLEEFAAKLGGEYLDHGELRTFRINLTDMVMQAALQKTSLTLRGFVDQQNEVLRKVLAQTVGGIQNINFDGQVQMSKDDEKTVLTSFFSLGSFAYYKLFREGGGALEDIANKLESFSVDGRPLRILIRSYGIAFPWQLLHNDRDPSQSADGFWGFKYAITADYLGRSYGGALPDAFEKTTTDFSVFGEYRASPGEAPVVSVLAQKQAAYFQAIWESTNFATADSSQTFLDSIRQHRDKLDFLMIYAHGSSGSVITKLQDGTIATVDEAAGPRMMFSQTENMLPYDLEQLPVGAVLGGNAYLSRQPIIVLNACDTGSSALARGTNRLTLPVAFLDIGARGVVATEAPVWNIFAYQFGNELIGEILKGSAVGPGLLAVRIKFLNSYNNPFGLLYSYYGNASAKVLVN
jgi:hypothetical protein